MTQLQKEGLAYVAREPRSAAPTVSAVHRERTPEVLDGELIADAQCPRRNGLHRVSIRAAAIYTADHQGKITRQWSRG